MIDEVFEFKIGNIPSYLFNNHKWALYAWAKEIKKGNLIKGSSLVHTDSHEDLGLPDRLIETISPDDLSMLLKQDSGMIQCNSYIAPLLYEGIFKSISWVFPEWEYGPELDKQHTELSIGKLTGNYIFFNQEDIPKSLEQGKNFVYRRLISKDLSNLSGKAALNIDLDYFLCHRFSGALDPITKFLRKNGYAEKYIEEYRKKIPEPELQEVDRRINYFIGNLEKSKLEPIVITIATSSGRLFTPSEKANYIQRNLVEGLKEIYSPS
jgi:hypothetical protein